MKTALKSESFSRIVFYLGCWALMGGLVRGQSAPPNAATSRTEDRKEVADAIQRVKAGTFNNYHVEVIGEAGAKAAIPDLEIQFTRATDTLDKAKIAQVLVKLGDKGDTYWNFLVTLATPAIESDAPDFNGYDSQGKSVPGPSPEFLGWMKAHNLSPSPELFERQVYIWPGEVGLLGATEDQRAVPLLRQALSSPNHMIEIAAAVGLAELQDKESSSLIVDACNRAPAEVANVMAGALVYFDDPESHAAVDRYIPKDEARMLRNDRAQGKKLLSK